jgi:acetoacetyl-CoA synthetase
MPTGFVGDTDDSRYIESYFSTYPGVWRHGDWVRFTRDGTAVVLGRSDATINRGGIRMGTAEIYRAVLAEDDVLDALVVDVPDAGGGDSWMPLFVVLADGSELTEELRARIARRVRADCSPRHVPDEIIRIAEVPRTLTGKALEVPVKKVLMGHDPAGVTSRDALANPAAFEWFVCLRRQRVGAAS